MVHKPPAVTTCSPMPNERDDMMKTHRNPAQDDTNKKSERMESPSCEIKKMTLAIGLIMIVFRKRLIIHNNQKRFMTDCGAWPEDWANVGTTHQQQGDLNRSADNVLAGFYPRDVIKWLPQNSR